MKEDSYKEDLYKPYKIYYNVYKIHYYINENISKYSLSDLVTACRDNRTDLVRDIVSNIDNKQYFDNLGSCLKASIDNRNFDILKLLLDWGDKNYNQKLWEGGETALHVLVKTSGNEVGVKLLLEAGASLFVGSNNSIPLSIKEYYDNSYLTLIKQHILSKKLSTDYKNPCEYLYSEGGYNSEALRLVTDIAKETYETYAVLSDIVQENEGKNFHKAVILGLEEFFQTQGAKTYPPEIITDVLNYVFGLELNRDEYKHDCSKASSTDAEELSTSGETSEEVRASEIHEALDVRYPHSWGGGMICDAGALSTSGETSEEVRASEIHEALDVRYPHSWGGGMISDAGALSTSGEMSQEVRASEIHEALAAGCPHSLGVGMISGAEALATLGENE